MLISIPLFIEQERNASRELDEILMRERILWKEKAKAKWLEEGDANTHFFHVSTISHRRYNHIPFLFDVNDARISDIDLIGQKFVAFYSNLFSTSRHCFPLNLQDLIVPTIAFEDNVRFTHTPDASEIRSVVSSMNGNTGPGPDGIIPTFYKQFWSIIGEDVISAVQKFFDLGIVSRTANHTFLALIPKRIAANRVEQFRHIALCNVIYKIITKILAGRIKDHLDKIIHPSQSAFVPHRSILDNIIINHEVMSYLNNRKGNNGFIAVKVDMAKTYDMVE